MITNPTLRKKNLKLHEIHLKYSVRGISSIYAMKDPLHIIDVGDSSPM